MPSRQGVLIEDLLNLKQRKAEGEKKKQRIISVSLPKLHRHNHFLSCLYTEARLELNRN